MRRVALLERRRMRRVALLERRHSRLHLCLEPLLVSRPGRLLILQLTRELLCELLEVGLRIDDGLLLHTHRARAELQRPLGL